MSKLNKFLIGKNIIGAAFAIIIATIMALVAIPSLVNLGLIEYHWYYYLVPVFIAVFIIVASAWSVHNIKSGVVDEVTQKIANMVGNSVVKK